MGFKIEDRSFNVFTTAAGKVLKLQVTEEFQIKVKLVKRAYLVKSNGMNFLTLDAG